jgi:hypothetical protein
MADNPNINKKSIDESLEAMDDLLFVTRDFTSEMVKVSKLFFKNNEQANATVATFRALSKSTETLASQLKSVEKGEMSLKDISKIRVQYEERKKKLQTEFRQALGKIKLTEEQIEKITKGELDLKTAIGKQAKKFTTGQKDLLNIYEEQFKINQEQDSLYDNITDKLQKQNDAVGTMTNTFEGLDGVLRKSGFNNLAERMNINGAVDGGKKLAAELTNGGERAATTGEKFQIMGNVVGNIGKNLMKALGPIAIIAFVVQQIVEAFTALDKMSGEVAKNMGVSANEGQKLVMEMTDLANSSKGVNVTTQQLVQAQMDMNENLGTSVKFSNEMAEEFALIQNRTGLSSESMASFQKISLISGKSMKDNLKTISNTTVQLNSQNKINFNVKKIQEEVAKSSNAILLNNKGNLEQLTKSVIESKKLGVSMSQLESISNSLLDFESSIAAELEAELLLGKDINLETARQAALQGDMAKVAEEVLKNKAIMNAFDTKNVIAQEAAAKALGMGREELATMVTEQQQLEALKKSGFDSVSDAQNEFNKMIESGMSMEEASNVMKQKGLDDALTKQLESETRAEKMAKFQEKLGNLFMILADAITPLIDSLMQILQPLMQILQPIFKLVGFITQMIAGPLSAVINTLTTMFGYFGDVIDGFFGEDGSILNGLKALAKAVISVVLFPIQLMIDGVIGMVNAVISGASYIAESLGFSGFSNIKSPNLTEGLSGMVGLAEGGVVTKPTQALIGEGGEPEAVIPLSKAKDMGFGGDNKSQATQPPTQPNQNTERMIALLQQQNALLQQIASRQTTIEMNGDKVGQGIQKADRAIQ